MVLAQHGTAPVDPDSTLDIQNGELTPMTTSQAFKPPSGYSPTSAGYPASSTFATAASFSTSWGTTFFVSSSVAHTRSSLGIVRVEEADEYAVRLFWARSADIMNVVQVARGCQDRGVRVESGEEAQLGGSENSDSGGESKARGGNRRPGGSCKSKTALARGL